MFTLRPLRTLTVLLCLAPFGLTHAQILIGGAVKNGDFNAGPGADDKRRFADTPDWTNLTGGQNIQATRLNLDFDGSRNAVLVLDDARLFGNGTDYTIQEGDIFDVEIKWRAGSGFDPVSDTFNVVMWAMDENGNPINSPISRRVIQSQNMTTDTNVYQTVTSSTDPVPADSEWIGLGYQFILEIGQIGDHFVWIDDLSLIGGIGANLVTPEPTITFMDYEPSTKHVTLHWTDEGGTYKVQASDGHDWSGAGDIPLDGSESNVDGEIQYQFNDPNATGPERFWRVAE